MVDKILLDILKDQVTPRLVVEPIAVALAVAKPKKLLHTYRTK